MVAYAAALEEPYEHSALAQMRITERASMGSYGGGALRTRHIETIQNTDLASLTPRMVAALEEPVDPFACGVYVVARAAAKHVKVAIGGDGGDELFAGYDRYKGQQLAEIYSHVPRVLRHKLCARCSAAFRTASDTTLSPASCAGWMKPRISTVSNGTRTAQPS